MPQLPAGPPIGSSPELPAPEGSSVVGEEVVSLLVPADDDDAPPELDEVVGPDDPLVVVEEASVSIPPPLSSPQPATNQADTSTTQDHRRPMLIRYT